MYINTETKEIKSWNQLRKLYPAISIPRDGTEVILELWQKITVAPAPTYDPLTHRIELQDPNEHFTRIYKLIDIPQEEQDLQAKRSVEAAGERLIRQHVQPHKAKTDLTLKKLTLGIPVTMPDREFLKELVVYEDRVRHQMHKAKPIWPGEPNVRTERNR